MALRHFLQFMPALARLIPLAVTKEPREYQGKKSWGVKDDHGQWWSLYVEQQPKRGDVFEVETKERTGKDGRVFRDAFPKAQPQAQAAPEPKAAVAPNQNDVANAALYYLDALKLNLEQLTEPQASLLCTCIISTFGKDNRASWDRAKSIDYLEGMPADEPPFPDEDSAAASGRYDTPPF